MGIFKVKSEHIAILKQLGWLTVVTCYWEVLDKNCDEIIIKSHHTLTGKTVKNTLNGFL